MQAEELGEQRLVLEVHENIARARGVSASNYSAHQGHFRRHTNFLRVATRRHNKGWTLRLIRPRQPPPRDDRFLEHYPRLSGSI
jgi:hypothetical protein